MRGNIAPPGESAHSRFPYGATYNPNPRPVAKNVIELILGGARSGKSDHAERLAAESGLAVTYIATAASGDAEMAARIAQHRVRRPAEWRTVESPLFLAETLRAESAEDRCLLIDCLTLWLSNHLWSLFEMPDDADLVLPEPYLKARQNLIATLPTLPGRVLFVSNELGGGIVPMGAATRIYRDEAGWLNQAVARLADRVALVTAGLPLLLKPAQPVVAP